MSTLKILKFCSNSAMVFGIFFKFEISSFPAGFSFRQVLSRLALFTLLSYRRQRGTSTDSPKLSSAARNEYRLPKVNRRQRGTRYDSPKLIASEVKKSESDSFLVLYFSSN